LEHVTIKVRVPLGPLTMFLPAASPNHSLALWSSCLCGVACRMIRLAKLVTFFLELNVATAERPDRASSEEGTRGPSFPFFFWRRALRAVSIRPTHHHRSALHPIRSIRLPGWARSTFLPAIFEVRLAVRLRLSFGPAGSHPGKKLISPHRSNSTRDVLLPLSSPQPYSPSMIVSFSFLME
jgi:hypothetical protein